MVFSPVDELSEHGLHPRSDLGVSLFGRRLGGPELPGQLLEPVGQDPLHSRVPWVFLQNPGLHLTGKLRETGLAEPPTQGRPTGWGFPLVLYDVPDICGDPGVLFRFAQPRVPKDGRPEAGMDHGARSKGGGPFKVGEGPFRVASEHKEDDSGFQIRRQVIGVLLEDPVEDGEHLVHYGVGGPARGWPHGRRQGYPNLGMGLHLPRKVLRECHGLISAPELIQGISSQENRFDEVRQSFQGFLAGLHRLLRVGLVLGPGNRGRGGEGAPGGVRVLGGQGPSHLLSREVPPRLGQVCDGPGLELHGVGGPAGPPLPQLCPVLVVLETEGLPDLHLRLHELFGGEVWSPLSAAREKEGKDDQGKGEEEIDELPGPSRGFRHAEGHPFSFGQPLGCPNPPDRDRKAVAIKG